MYGKRESTFLRLNWRAQSTPLALVRQTLEKIATSFVNVFTLRSLWPIKSQKEIQRLKGTFIFGSFHASLVRLNNYSPFERKYIYILSNINSAVGCDDD